mgnify:CR=1 FL=1
MSDRLPIILDCDPGHDDAIAIIVAARHTEVLGITTVAGNAPLSATTRKCVWHSEQRMPTSASTPAKPKPHSSGMYDAMKMPAKLATCQPAQLRKQLPLR